MRSLAKLFLIISLVAMPVLCSSQVFTALEFTNLAYKNKEDIKQAIESKGYSFYSTEKSDMSENDVFSAVNNMKVSIIFPNFEDGQNMISWEFIDNELYNKLGRELVAAGFKKLEVERRNQGKYVVTTYQRPGLTVTLSSDKLISTSGINTLSVRYSSAPWSSVQ